MKNQAKNEQLGQSNKTAQKQTGIKNQAPTSEYTSSKKSPVTDEDESDIQTNKYNPSKNVTNKNETEDAYRKNGKQDNTIRDAYKNTLSEVTEKNNAQDRNTTKTGTKQNEIQIGSKTSTNNTSKKANDTLREDDDMEDEEDFEDEEEDDEEYATSKTKSQKEREENDHDHDYKTPIGKLNNNPAHKDTTSNKSQNTGRNSDRKF